MIDDDHVDGAGARSGGPPAAATCPACRSERLSRIGDYNSFDNHARFAGMGRSRRGRPRDLTVKPTKCRICLACGYVLLFVDDEGRAEVAGPPDDG